MHYLQAWNEAVCSGAWGKRATRWAEKIRRSLDLDHWSSFHESFIKLGGLIQATGTGEKGEHPASIIVLSGDAHHGYAAEVTFRDEDVKSLVYQVVCSPFRNALPSIKAHLQSLAWRKPGELAGRFLGRLVGIQKEKMSWRLVHRKLWFENQVAILELEDRRARLSFEKATPGAYGKPDLQKIYERYLA